jgi:hypothetical protein
MYNSIKMPKKNNKEIKCPGRIIYEDDMGQRAEITAPTLITLFFSDKLIQSFNKDPDREYSMKELWKLTNCVGGERPAISSVGSNVKANIKIFFRDTAVRPTKQGLMRVNVAKLKPIVNNIIKAVQNIKSDYDSKK